MIRYVGRVHVVDTEGTDISTVVFSPRLFASPDFCVVPVCLTDGRIDEHEIWTWWYM